MAAPMSQLAEQLARVVAERDQLRARVAALEAEKHAFGNRIALLSTLAIRALAERWSLPAYERELARLTALAASEPTP